MSGQTLAFIGLVICILALFILLLMLRHRVIKVEDVLHHMLIPGGLVTECRDHARSVAHAVVSVRRKELDEQERAIHEEMGKLTAAIFQVTSHMQEFINMLRAPRFIVDLEEALYGRKAGGGGHSPGGGGDEGRAGPQDDLPDAQGEAGGGR